LIAEVRQITVTAVTKNTQKQPATVLSNDIFNQLRREAHSNTEYGVPDHTL